MKFKNKKNIHIDHYNIHLFFTVWIHFNYLENTLSALIG